MTVGQDQHTDRGRWQEARGSWETGSFQGPQPGGCLPVPGCVCVWGGGTQRMLLGVRPSLVDSEQNDHLVAAHTPGWREGC